MGRRHYDSSDEAAQAADDHWSEFGDQPHYDEQDYGYEATGPETIIEEIPLPVVEIFGGTGCTFCTKAVEFCEERGLMFTSKNMDEDHEAFDQLVGRIKNWKTVPQIFIGANHLGGYDDLVRHYESLH